jgi:hypothetical protein
MKARKIFWPFLGERFAIPGKHLHESLINVTNIKSIALQSLIAVEEPSRELFYAIGSLCLDQLISLRHRGAFSTVAQTFSQCCEKVRSSDNSGVHGLIQEWYKVGTIWQQTMLRRLIKYRLLWPRLTSKRID